MGEPGDSGAYDLAPEVVAKERGPVVRPAERVEGAPSMAYRSGAPEKGRPIDEEKLKNLYLPLWLLGGGVVIEVLASLLRGRSWDEALKWVGVQIIGGTVVMLGGILLAARFRGLQLGNFWTAAFKLAAISVAPAALADLATPMLRFVPLGGLIAWAGEFVLYFALLGAMFDLDESDTWYCVLVIFLVQLAFYFGGMAVMARLAV